MRKGFSGEGRRWERGLEEVRGKKARQRRRKKKQQRNKKCLPPPFHP